MTNPLSNSGKPTLPPSTSRSEARSPNSNAAAPAKPTASSQTAQDTVSLGQGRGTDSALTYANPRSILREERPDLASLLEQSERDVAAFMLQLRGIIDEQGLEWNKVFRGEQKLTASVEEIEAAKAAIAEDGEWGVRKTAERILNFALGTSGGDASKLDKLRAAIQDGFDQAREALGGQLPPISEDTYAAVMAELDRWGQEGMPTGQVSLAPKTQDEAAS
jgi:hypothetical protein